MAAVLGFGDLGALEEPVPLDRVHLPAPRLSPPAELAGICSQTAHDRASHAYGQSYRDLIRAFRGRFDHLPDVVARPRGEDDIAALLGWCETAGAAAIAFGGGTSVTGGVEPDVGGGYAGAVSIDLSLMGRVLEVDGVSGAALVEAGTTGPSLNAQLARHGHTLRHFPQSWEFSTVGGWIATRAGGHYATLHTRIDDFVESVRAVTPRGPWQSRRLPGSGAGVSPDRMLLGSEGILGVITRAWLRVQRAPAHRASAAVSFPSFGAGADAVRQIAGSGLYPAACRLLDPAEAALTAGADGSRALLVLGFESADHPVTSWLETALRIAAGHGGQWDGIRSTDAPGPAGDDGRAAGHWRAAFRQMPYLRNVYPAMGVLAETFETAVTWDAFPVLHENVLQATQQAARRACGRAIVMCRLAFAYPDGAAPYYTVLAPARRGEEIAQWDTIKRAASDALLAAGGTITHHHAVGRDHLPWYERQRPEPFGMALRGAKEAVDPHGILNPGVLLPPGAGRGSCVGGSPAPGSRDGGSPAAGTGTGELREGEDLVAALGHQHGVLELSSPPSVPGHGRPAVRPDVIADGAQGEHRLDRERHPRLHHDVGLRIVEVRDDQPGVERGPDAVPGEIAHHAVTESPGVGLDHPADGIQRPAGRHHADPPHHRLAGAPHEQP
jgi:alkyldihydroxyacetonephosphate synthase